MTVAVPAEVYTILPNSILPGTERSRGGQEMACHIRHRSCLEVHGAAVLVDHIAAVLQVMGRS